MSKSAIYTVNTNAQALAVGSVIDPGSVIRRYGQNIRLEGDDIRVSGSGYYKVTADVTITGTTAGTVTVSLLKDGTAISNSSITVASGAVATIPILAIIREYGCCCDNTSTLSFVLSGTAETVSGINVIVEKM